MIRKLLVPSLAFAAPAILALSAGAEDNRTTARELAKAGIAAANAGDCAKAIDLLERAEALFHAPTHLLFLARCYERRGRLVDAYETWRRIELDPTAVDGSPAFRAAHVEAKKARPALEPRLAHLTVKPAASYASLELKVDGARWTPAMLGIPKVIDPGAHRIEAAAPSFVSTDATVTLAEGESKTWELVLSPGSSASAAPAESTSASVAASTSAVPAASSTAVVAKVDDSPGSGRAWRTVGWGTGAAGVAAIGVGVGFGIAAKSAYDSLTTRCPVRSSCTATDVARRGADQQTVANTLFVAGGVIAATGLGLVLFVKDTPRAPLALSLVPSPSGVHASLAGVF